MSKILELIAEQLLPMSTEEVFRNFSGIAQISDTQTFVVELVQFPPQHIV